MGFTVDVSVPAVTVFLQGLLSFFSPCVLPLLPLYIGYLSGGTGKRGEDGRFYYDRKKVLLHTVFFVLGVSFAFFVLGLVVSAAGRFFKSNQMMFARVGGILVVLFGLYQLGLFGESKVLGTERRLPFRLNVLAMSPLTALLMGFTFSFAWTPCVGPALASVLLMAASAATKTAGFLLIGVYTTGFVLPFLAVGFFTTSLLEFFKRHGDVVRYTGKAGAVLMIVMGVLMFTGKMNDVTGYLSVISETGTERTGSVQQDASGDAAGEGENAPESQSPAAGDAGGTGAGRAPEENAAADHEDAPGTGDSGSAGNGSQPGAGEDENAGDGAPDVLPAIDFTLKDQYGTEHTLSDYKGKTVFLNFWATWCPPCRNEMPDIQEIYEEYQAAGDDSVVILGIAAPDYGNEQSEEGIKSFLEENGYTYPVVMDHGGEMFWQYGVFSYPTTFMIDADGNVFGYAAGQLNKDLMESIIRQTVEGRREQEPPAGETVTEEESMYGEETSYQKITAEMAKQIMDGGAATVADVRTAEEYEEGHIPGAVLVPNESIGEERPEALPDPEALILVYCRSGNRSRQAAEKLLELGYMNVYDFGGITDWPYEIVKGE